MSYGAATSLQAAAVRPGLAFVIADASYSSMSEIASAQADTQFGAWANIFVPGALFISGLRGGFDPAQAAPKDAVRGLTTPVLLVHSTTDEFTPSQHSEAIFANSDQRLMPGAWPPMVTIRSPSSRTSRSHSGNLRAQGRAAISDRV